MLASSDGTLGWAFFNATNPNLTLTLENVLMEHTRWVFVQSNDYAETGIKIYPDNVDSTAWGIVHALTNPEWSKKHVVKARQSVEELFNWSRIASLTIDVYRRTLGSNHRP